jgi:hypothetical protein
MYFTISRHIGHSTAVTNTSAVGARAVCGLDTGQEGTDSTVMFLKRPATKPDPREALT